MKKLDLAGLTSVFILNFNIQTHSMYYRNAKHIAAVKADFKYINEFLQSLPEYIDGRDKIIQNPDDGISIEFRDIDFTIFGTDNQIYSGLNLSIPVNQSLVIMGKYWKR